MLLLAAFNYAIDPLWCFSHTNWFTSYQRPFNERQQKTNYLTYVNTTKYDALILGNSRVCMVNQTDFSGKQVYNYSVAGLTPYEYRDYIDYFKKVAGCPATIFLGLHFQNSNRQSTAHVDPPEYYIKKAQSPSYRYNVLFTRDTFMYSRDNLLIKKTILKKKNNGSFYVYDRDNIATLINANDESKRLDSIRSAVTDLRKTYRNDYTYRSDLAESLTELIQTNPNTRFIPFTTPVSKPYFCAMVLEGKFPQYERWLKEMVGVFGQVWHFEYLNSITLDYSKNFSDSHHFYAPIGTMIAHRINGENDINTPSDFGILLTKDNIDEQLVKIKTESVSCR
jgi:hypothetical protein